MRRCSLALILSLSAPAFAQAPATTPEPSAAPPPAEQPAPAPAAPPKVEQAPAEQPKASAEEPAAPEAKPRPARQKPTATAAPSTETKPASPAPSAAAPSPAPVAAPPRVEPKPATATAQPVELNRPELPPIPEDAPRTPEEIRLADIKTSARFLFQTLLTGDVRSTANELFYPFQLEEKRYATPEELVASWVKQLRLKRTDLVTLYDVEVLSLEAMEKKYGKAPARLGLDLRGVKDVWVAVGNLSGRAGVFLYKPYGNEYRAFAYTD